MWTFHHRNHTPVLFDTAILLAIPAALTLVHVWLPTAISTQMLFTYGDPNPATAWTTVLLHSSNAHLYGNIAGYGLAIGFAYVLYVAFMHKRRRFWLTVGCLVLLVPPVTKVIDYVVLYQYAGVLADGASSRGISAVASAFGGMLLAGIGSFVADEYDSEVGALALLLICLFSLGILAATKGALSPTIAGLLALGSILLATAFGRRTDIEDLPELRVRVAEHAEIGVQVACFGAVVSVLLYLMLPVDIVRGDTFTNVLSHATGFLVGLLLSLLIAWISTS